MAEALAQTEWPSMPIPEPIKQMLRNFFIYGDVNTAESQRKLGEEVFTSDGEIIVNTRKMSGVTEILSGNHRILSLIKARKHDIHKIYACNDAGDDLLLIGQVTWVYKSGNSATAGFAARAVFQDGPSQHPRLKQYQGWLDPRELEAGLQTP